METISMYSKPNFNTAPNLNKVLNRVKVDILVKVAAIFLLFSQSLLSHAQTDAYDGKIQTIDLINLSHTDYGFTDHPLIEMELQKRFIDIALDYAEATKTTNGGLEFIPYQDNIPNTCKSFFVADSWVKLACKEGVTVWASSTSPVFELGKHTFFLSGDIQEPANSNIIQSMIYNNAWGVNFPTEYTGKTVCEYDVFRRQNIIDAAQTTSITDTYLVKPLVVIHSETPEDDAYDKWLNDAATRSQYQTTDPNLNPNLNKAQNLVKVDDQTTE